MDGLVS
jgi:hypothetical protein